MGERARSRGTSIRLYLVDGRADGLRLVEKSNWTGIGIVCSRSEYPTARSRDEYTRPGVYVLLGRTLAGATQNRVYVGEADELKTRIDSQVKSKDFWTQVVAFTSKDANLNKAHVRYLEARLITLAVQAKRADLENGTAPPMPHLSEPDQAEMEAFLDEMLVILPILGVLAFEIPAESATTAPSERLYLRGKGGVEAVGSDRPEGFVVFEGAGARADTVPSIHPFLARIRDDLVKEGVLLQDGQHLRLTKTHVFESPSTAAGVLLGRSANGRIEWRDAADRTLKELQNAAVEDAKGQG
jgi:hypothetical protein